MVPPRKNGLCLFVPAILCLVCSLLGTFEARGFSPASPSGSGPAATRPQRLPRSTPRSWAAVQGVVKDESGKPVVGAVVEVTHRDTGETFRILANSDGVFRFLELPPGPYQLRVEKSGFQPLLRPELRLPAGETTVLELRLESRPAEPAPAEEVEPAPTPPYRPLRRREEREPEPPAMELPPADKVFLPAPDRWEYGWPKWDRYDKEGPIPYTRGRWWDPYNRNPLKGDYPVIGQRTFFNFTFLSETILDGRRIPIPANISTARPLSEEFFGRDGQFFLNQVMRFSFDLFHGDTAFRPFDWRVRVTPAVSINYLNTAEQGIVNIDVREGTNRLDAHLGLQEAFGEVKLFDLSPYYDFLSLRAGIQPFSSDFRGFLYVEEQPAIRFFGTLNSNRWEYNLAYFFHLEKDTNAILNTLDYRHQQVFIANLYLQDFIWLGYTTQFSFHYNKDDADFKFDDNEFLVRPAPVGAVRPHDVRVAYLGWTGNGHIGRLNISHAFYQALGDDDLNPISGDRLDINAQFVAAELSVDKDWVRLKGSFIWASGDPDPRDQDGQGFDAIVDFPVFAGGLFSFWNRQAIRLTGTGVALVNLNSFLPNLRPNKEQGQANFVNPGLFLYNVGADIELTPKLRSLINFNYLNFHRTESLELLDFQAPIRSHIGTEYNFGFQYRPPLTENIVLNTGFSVFQPGGGFQDLLQSRTLLQLFSDVRVQF